MRKSAWTKKEKSNRSMKVEQWSFIRTKIPTQMISLMKLVFAIKNCRKALILYAFPEDNLPKKKMKLGQKKNKDKLVNSKKD